MAGHPPAAGAARGLAGRLGPLLFLSFCAACAPGAQNAFTLRGSITAPPRLQKRAEKPNSVLMIVATNSAGVPVAVKRIINPRFPLHYTMNENDLLLPGPIWQGPLTVTVHVNKHGRLGIQRKRDLRGYHRGTARSGDRSVDIVIDQEV